LPAQGQGPQRRNIARGQEKARKSKTRIVLKRLFDDTRDLNQQGRRKRRARNGKQVGAA
jgi:hypothetical protein